MVPHPPNIGVLVLFPTRKQTESPIYIIQKSHFIYGGQATGHFLWKFRLIFLFYFERQISMQIGKIFLHISI